MDIWDRFWSKVEEPFDAHNDCWIWKGACDKKSGYGKFKIGARHTPVVQAHRFSYVFFNGPIPERHEVHHNCENPPCVNPTHLEALTNAEHRLRSPQFLVSISAWRRAITHCPQGHLYDAENTYLNKKGTRQCKECKRRRFRDWYKRHKDYYSQYRESRRSSQEPR